MKFHNVVNIVEKFHKGNLSRNIQSAYLIENGPDNYYHKIIKNFITMIRGD